jgi:SH3-like domain-containing protein
VLPAPQAAVGTPVGQQVVETPQPKASATPVRAATAAPSPQAGERVRIANTDGIGVALRDGPGGNRLPGKGYDEGVTVSVLERQGAWAHIRGDDGRDGWVLAVTVPPKSPSR